MGFTKDPKRQLDPKGPLGSPKRPIFLSGEKKRQSTSPGQEIIRKTRLIRMRRMRCPEYIHPIVTEAVEFVKENKVFIKWQNNSCHASGFALCELVSYDALGRYYWFDSNQTQIMLQNVELQLISVFRVVSLEHALDRETTTLLEVLQRVNCHVLNNPRAFGSFYDPVDNVDAISNLSLHPRNIVLDIALYPTENSNPHTCIRSVKFTTRHMSWVQAAPLNEEDSLENSIIRGIDAIYGTRETKRVIRCDDPDENGNACGVQNESAVRRIHFGALICVTVASDHIRNIPFVLNFGVNFVSLMILYIYISFFRIKLGT